eukprot:m.46645 g.46645  ORF g.46645 m.46645 type:complete len:1051 (-) comp20300_c1_seq2:177-3329(-)
MFFSIADVLFVCVKGATSEEQCGLMFFKWNANVGCLAYTKADDCAGKTLWSTGQCTPDGTYISLTGTAVSTQITDIVTPGTRAVTRLHRKQLKYTVLEGQAFDVKVDACTFVASLRIYLVHTSTSGVDNDRRNIYMEEVFRCDDCSQGLYTHAKFEKRLGAYAQPTLGVGTYIIEVIGHGSQKTSTEAAGDAGEAFTITIASANNNVCTGNTMCTDYGVKETTLASASCACSTPGEVCSSEHWDVECLDGFEPIISGSTHCSEFGTAPVCSVTAGVRLFLYSSDDYYPVGPNSAVRPSQRCGITATALRESVQVSLSTAKEAAMATLSNPAHDQLAAISFANVRIHSTCFLGAPDTQQATIEVDVPVPSTWIPANTGGLSDAICQAVMSDLKKTLAFVVYKLIGSLGNPTFVAAVHTVGTGIGHTITHDMLSTFPQLPTTPLSFIRHIRDLEGQGVYEVALTINNVVIIEDDNVIADSLVFPVATGFPCSDSQNTFACPSPAADTTCAQPMAFCSAKFQYALHPGFRRNTVEGLVCASLGCNQIVLLQADGSPAIGSHGVTSSGTGNGMQITTQVAGTGLKFDVSFDVGVLGSVPYENEKTLTVVGVAGLQYKITTTAVLVFKGLYAVVPSAVGSGFIVNGILSGTINGLAVSFKILTVSANGGVATFVPTSSWSVVELAANHALYFPTGSNQRATIAIPSPSAGGIAASFEIYGNDAFVSVDRSTCCTAYACDAVCTTNCIPQEYRTQDTNECSASFTCPSSTASILATSATFYQSHTCASPTTARRRRSEGSQRKITKLTNGIDTTASRSTAIQSKAVTVQSKMCLWENTSQWQPSRGVHPQDGDTRSWFHTWWQPCATCMDARRVGTRRVGRLRVCGGLLEESQTGCRAISVGGDAQASFEQDLAQRWDCSVDAFSLPPATDMPSPPLSKLIHVHTDTRINTTDGAGLDEFVTTTHSTVHVLKFDCHGCEFERLCRNVAMQQFVRTHVQQLILRVEFSEDTTSELWKCVAEDLGMAAFSKKIILGSSVVDYSFVNTHYVKTGVTTSV